LESRTGRTSYLTIWGVKICLHVQFWLKSDHNDRLTRDYVAYMAHTVKFYEKSRLYVVHDVTFDKNPPHVIHNQLRSLVAWGGGGSPCVAESEGQQSGQQLNARSQ
jgi:hypothetical protein